MNPLCKSCSKARYLIYYPKNKEKFFESAKRGYQRKKAFIDSLKSKACADCKKRYPSIVMDFDHIKKGKILAVSQLFVGGKSMKDVIDEIKKCEVVCSNCHRIRTWKRRLEK